MAEPQWVPTVDDLRVKLCYICREEERFDESEDPPRAWTHPCSCTLIAHESCLLQWIKSAQQDPSRVGNALKCPQCGAKYELESDNPLMLRILTKLNDVLSTAGQVVAVFSVASIAASFSLSIYVISTSYGAFAVKEFLGKEMYDLLLTDDPNKWPWYAYIQLPTIPISLILSRTRLFESLSLMPWFFIWATSTPVTSTSSSSSRLGAWSRNSSIPHSPAINWPPTPFMATILFPLIRAAYRRFFKKLTRYVMGTLDDPSAGGPIRRVVWALNENGPAPLRVRIGANIAPQANVPAPAPAAAPAANPAGQNADEPNDPPEDPAAVAERTLHVTTSSIGRFIGGALLIPTISNRMGTLLFRLSKHSAILRAFLAIRDRPRGGMGAAAAAAFPPQIRLFANPPESSASFFRQLSQGLFTGLNVMSGGTPAWNAQDPVWWRNAVGLGLFVFAKDCVHLLHLYLTRRELETRTVKNRSFAGVDIRELDLIRNPLAPPVAPTPSTQTQDQPQPDTATPVPS